MTFPLEVLEHYVVITTAGEYSTEDVLQTLAELPERSPAGIPLLVDGRASGHNPSVFELKDIVQEVYAIRDHIGNRAALVVASGVTFGIARMLQALGKSDDFEYRVFLDMDEARVWLSARDQSLG